jgi:hypothetical protein
LPLLAYMLPQEILRNGWTSQGRPRQRSRRGRHCGKGKPEKLNDNIWGSFIYHWVVNNSPGYCMQYQYLTCNTRVLQKLPQGYQNRG